MNTSYTNTLRIIYSLISIIILSVAVLPGSAAEYENKQQYYAYATTTTTTPTTTTTTSVTSALPDIINFNFATALNSGCTTNKTNKINNIIDQHPPLALRLSDYEYYGLNAHVFCHDIRPTANKMKNTVEKCVLTTGTLT